MRNIRGFTLIEIVITLGIMMLLTGGAVAGFNRYNDRQRLAQAGLTLQNNLRLAQNHANSGDKPTSGCTQLLGYQVSFTDYTYQFQAICSNGLAGEANSFTLANSLSFSPVPSSLVFNVLNQGINNGNAVTLNLTNGTLNYSLQIDPAGEIINSGFQ